MLTTFAFFQIKTILFSREVPGNILNTERRQRTTVNSLCLKNSVFVYVVFFFIGTGTYCFGFKIVGQPLTSTRTLFWKNSIEKWILN
jgi:hypothetical protein